MKQLSVILFPIIIISLSNSKDQFLADFLGCTKEYNINIEPWV